MEPIESITSWDLVAQALSAWQTDPEQQADKLQKLKKAQARCETEIDNEVDELYAQMFAVNFPFFVDLGVMQKIQDETTPLGDREEPGARKNFLAIFDGLIPVYELNHSRSDSTFTAPKWLERAMKLLNQKGWQCTIKLHDTEKYGSSEYNRAYLCIPDPRKSSEE